jgi:hypothetical protein
VTPEARAFGLLGALGFECDEPGVRRRVVAAIVRAIDAAVAERDAAWTRRLADRADELAFAARHARERGDAAGAAWLATTAEELRTAATTAKEGA